MKIDIRQRLIDDFEINLSIGPHDIDMESLDALILMSLQAYKNSMTAERDRLRKALEKFMGFYPNCAQLLDGWHADGTVWSAWDESVRQQLIRLGVIAQQALAGKEEGCK